jgi:hypothetical protein
MRSPPTTAPTTMAAWFSLVMACAADLDAGKITDKGRDYR